MINHFRPYSFILFCLFWLILTPRISTGLDTIDTDNLVPGMKGYGLSVFQGHEPIKFPVTFINIADGPWPGELTFLVLAELPEGYSDRGPLFGSGFSGSPIYFNGKLAGALSYVEQFQTELIMGITPISLMLEELERAKSSFPADMPESEKIAHKPLSADNKRLQAGSMIEIPLVRGDIRLSSAGTVTAVTDGMILAYGHENFFWGDQVMLPMHLVNVSAIIPRLDLSHKIAGSGKEIGAVVWDGKQAVVGKIGIRAPMTQFKLSFEYRKSGVVRHYNMEIVRHKSVIPFIVNQIVTTVIEQMAHDTPEERAFEIEYRVALSKNENLPRFSQRYDTNTLKSRIGATLHRLTENHPDDNIPESIGIYIKELATGKSARIRKAWFGKESVRAGDSVTLYGQIIHSTEEKMVISTTLTVPKDYSLDVFPVLLTSGSAIVPDEKQPVDHDSVTEWISRLLRSDDFVVLYPGARDKMAKYPEANVARTVKRIPWAVTGQAEASIRVLGNN